MRNASPALVALLNANTQFVTADLLTIILVDGTAIRLTNASVDITAVSQFDSASHLFSAGLPFTRGQTRVVIGTEVDTLDLTLSPSPANLLEGAPWPAGARAGLLDRAEVLLEKLIMPSWDDVSAGTLILFWGSAGTVTPSRSTVAMVVNSAMVLLQANMPRNLYQPGCIHALFDNGCELSQASFTVTGTAHAGSTTTSIATGLSFASGYYDLGALTWTSGANAGLSGVIRSSASGTVAMVSHFPVTPTIGDGFSMIPGCDKKQATCSGKFSNLAHFRGFPYIPSPESAR